MTRSRKLLVGIAVIVVLLVGLRLALPYIVEDYANRTLANLKAYRGHVGDVDIHLWRGAYSIDDVVIEKIGAHRPVPFFSTRRMDLSLEWHSLLKRRVVAAAEFDGPELNLVQGNGKEDSQLGGEEDWQARLEQLVPIHINSIKVNDGTVRFLAPGIQTHDAITARHVHGSVSNLTNVVNSQRETFADFNLAGTVLDSATAKVAGSVDPFARQPTFDVNMELKKAQLPKMNPWLLQYIKADAEAGTFELYVEMAAADGRFKGYAKPIIQDVKMHRGDEADESALRKLWEGFLDFAADVLTNKQADQVAARIPFSGSIENPHTSLFATISSALRNAFVSAFARSLEGSITLRDVKKDLKESDPNKEDESKKKSGKDKDKKTDESKTKDEGKEKESTTPKPGPAGKT